MNVKTATMRNLLLAMVVSLAFLKPTVAWASPSSSCSCPCTSSTSAQLSSQPDWSESVFYQPFLALQQLNQDMNNLMREAFYAPGKADVVHEQLYSRINMETTPKEYRITMTVPGLDEKDMKIEAGADNTLTIRGEKNLVQKTSSGTERSFGSFTQMLTLPSDADAAHLETSYKNGEYTVTLPRKGTELQSSNQPGSHDRSL